MKITKIQGREIFDSRGFPTLECQLTLEKDITVLASVPSGLSRGVHEAFELRDGGARLFGQGLLKSIDLLEHTIGPAFVGKEPNVVQMDRHMLEMDGTPNKSKLGANTTLALSMAIAKAQAVVEEIELYELIAYLYGAQTVTMPHALFNVINGGMHADNNLLIQEFLVIPIESASFRQAMEHTIELFYQLKSLLKKSGKTILVGDEGGFAPSFDSEFEALDILSEALMRIDNGKFFRIGLDIAASQIYDHHIQCYDWHGDFLTSKDLIEMYKKLVKTYPIYSIEDGLDQDDWQGWVALTQELGSTVQLAGDDLYVTSVDRIRHGISVGAGNAVIIKPNQIGTVTETLQTMQFCSEAKMNTIISHRSGETEDTFIADLAVGASAGQIKAGGCCRSERLSKYNRLLRIEDHLISSLLGF